MKYLILLLLAMPVWGEIDQPIMYQTTAQTYSIPFHIREGCYVWIESQSRLYESEYYFTKLEKLSLENGQWSEVGIEPNWDLFAFSIPGIYRINKPATVSAVGFRIATKSMGKEQDYKCYEDLLPTL